MKKNVVITGANRGIGLSLAKHYADLGWSVFACCRKPSAELSKPGIVTISGVDVADASTLSQITKALGQRDVDLVINNAGILRNEPLGAIDYKSVLSQFEVNALGPLRVSEVLMEHFSASAKLVMITSRMGSVEDNTSGGRYGYRMSKSALNIASVSLAHDLRSKGVAVGIIHPGLVGTEMIGGVGDITPDQAAQRIADRIEALNLQNSGTFWHSNGELLPW
ncbi:SDR family oxidoreductase [Arenicella sp. 4NH20-0111]|uniref:SDR family oxidoreductase n=1 Tax=Arenicella sp. 4NH20-0111 TaxID=3127648 RepID=UPI0031021801